MVLDSQGLKNSRTMDADSTETVQEIGISSGNMPSGRVWEPVNRFDTGSVFSRNSDGREHMVNERDLAFQELTISVETNGQGA